MSCGRPVAEQLEQQLAQAGGWLSRAEIDARLRLASRIALEDALASLVIAGQAEYRAGMGYRRVAPASRVRGVDRRV